MQARAYCDREGYPGHTASSTVLAFTNWTAEAKLQPTERPDVTSFVIGMRMATQPLSLLDTCAVQQCLLVHAHSTMALTAGGPTQYCAKSAAAAQCSSGQHATTSRLLVVACCPTSG